MKILLAIDDSKYSKAAIQQLIALSPPSDTEVRVLHVIEREMSYRDGQTWAFPIPHKEPTAEERAAAEELVSRAAQRLSGAGFTVVTAVEMGEPRVQIINAAEEWHADLIIVGSHGRRGLDRFLLGSVSEAVARSAHCSVQIARLPDGSE